METSLTPTRLGSISRLKTIADELKKFVVEQKLYTNIKGKNYAHVEAWQFAGANLGVLPLLRSVENQCTDNEIKYRVEIELRDKHQNPVGRGVAICSNKESGRGNQDEYVIMSMAQTRAIGKAYRNSFGWLMKLAGYQPTPAEEMTQTTKATSQAKADIKAKLGGGR